MNVLRTIYDLRGALQEAQASRSIGLVPTMGNLHAGHMALVEASRKQSHITVTSIFVNPTQFGPNEDVDKYPRTFAADAEKLEAAGVDFVFAPSVDEVYPEGRESQACVSVPALAGILCGADRPGHFDGVATVVTKLFNIVQPDYAYFGEKDWQQLTLLTTMVRQLNMPVEIVGVATVRARDGLALSSRNQDLNDEERQTAPILHRTLLDIRHGIEAGARNFDSLEQTGRVALKGAGFQTDYVAVRDADMLRPADRETKRLRVLAAARLGKARLIDNVPVDLAGIVGGSGDR